MKQTALQIEFYKLSLYAKEKNKTKQKKPLSFDLCPVPPAFAMPHICVT